MLNLKIYNQLLKVYGQIYATYQLINSAHKYVYEYEYSMFAILCEKDPTMHRLYTELQDACNEISHCILVQLNNIEETLETIEERTYYEREREEDFD